MTVYANSFESGTNGANITTTSSSGNDTNFSGRATNGGATILYSNAITINGGLSAQFTYPNNTAAYLEYAVSPPTTTSRVAVRVYVYLGSNPSGLSDVIFNYKNSSGTAGVFNVRASDGLLGMAGVGYTFVPPQFTWLRCEVGLAPGTTGGNGQVDFAVYYGESMTPVVTAFSSTANVGTTIITSVRFGSDAALGPRTDYLDNIAVNDALATGYIGPAFADQGSASAAWMV